MTQPTSQREEIYRLVDSFLTEAKDQNGNDRSLEQLNQDRHLFVDNMMELLAQAKSEWINECKQLAAMAFGKDHRNYEEFIKSLSLPSLTQKEEVE